MLRRRGPFLELRAAGVAAVAGILLTACKPAPETVVQGAASSTLRVGVGRVATNPNNGLRQLAQNMTVELLANFTEDGRLRPWLARDWNVSPDGLGLTINLTPGVKLHDGSALTAALVVNALQATLPTTMGQAYEDVDSVTATGENQVLVRFRSPSPFLLDSLEAPIRKPGAPLVGTGPYVVSEGSNLSELRANPDYYLGPPTIGRGLCGRCPAHVPNAPPSPSSRTSCSPLRPAGAPTPARLVNRAREGRRGPRLPQRDERSGWPSVSICSPPTGVGQTPLKYRPVYADTIAPTRFTSRIFFRVYIVTYSAIGNHRKW